MVDLTTLAALTPYANVRGPLYTVVVVGVWSATLGLWSDGESSVWSTDVECAMTVVGALITRTGSSVVSDVGAVIVVISWCMTAGGLVSLLLTCVVPCDCHGAESAYVRGTIEMSLSGIANVLSVKYSDSFVED